jgi:hypothetical protein
MTKMAIKTPIEELINSVGNMAQGLDADELYDYFIKTATELLEREKKEICNAYFRGKMDSVTDNRGHMIAELYFKERYGNEK